MLVRRNRVNTAVLCLAVALCGACAPDEHTSSGDDLPVTLEDPAAVEREVQRVFNDAACWCQSHLLLPNRGSGVPTSVRTAPLNIPDVQYYAYEERLNRFAQTHAPDPATCELSED